MSNNATPAPPGRHRPPPRVPHREGGDPPVRLGRTYGYRMLKSTGFPRRIGDRFRLDTVISWEQAVLAGELSGRPDEPESPGDAAATVTEPEPEPMPPAGGTVPIGDDVPVEAPTRRRTRGTRRAA